MRYRSVCLSLFLCFLFCIPAFAGETTTKVMSFAGQYQNALNSVGQSLSGAGKQIFFFLLVFELLGTWLKLLFEGKLEAQSFVMSSCKVIIILTVWFFFIDHAWSILEDVSGFITSALSNKPAGLNDLIQNAFNMARAPKLALDTYADPIIGWKHPIEDIKYVGALIIIGIADLIILLAMIFAYITALVTQAKLCMVMSFAILALGFSGSQFTRDIAMNGFKTTIAVSVELLVIYTLMSVSQTVFSSFMTYTPTSWEDCYVFVWECTVAAVVLSALFQQLPGVVSGMFGQGGGGGGSALVGASMAISAASMAKSAASIAKNTATGAANKTRGAVGSVKEHMGSSSKSSTMGRLGDGIMGAVKEKRKNRAASLKDSFLNRQWSSQDQNGAGHP